MPLSEQTKAPKGADSTNCPGTANNKRESRLGQRGVATLVDSGSADATTTIENDHDDGDTTIGGDGPVNSRPSRPKRKQRQEQQQQEKKKKKSNRHDNPRERCSGSWGRGSGGSYLAEGGHLPDLRQFHDTLQTNSAEVTHYSPQQQYQDVGQQGLQFHSGKELHANPGGTSMPSSSNPLDDEYLQTYINGRPAVFDSSRFASYNSHSVGKSSPAQSSRRIESPQQRNFSFGSAGAHVLSDGIYGGGVSSPPYRSPVGPSSFVENFGSGSSYGQSIEVGYGLNLSDESLMNDILGDVERD